MIWMTRPTKLRVVLARATYEQHFAPARQAEHLEAILARAIDRRQARVVARPADAIA